MGKSKLGFGIVGCGTISSWHADAIANIPSAELVAVTDVFEKSRKDFAEKYKVTAVSSYEELLTRDDIDIVCICTPSGLHASMAVKAADAKKHIIIEKPMAITPVQVKDVIDACDRNNVKVEVMSQLRFLSAIEQLKSAIDKGWLGKIVTSNLDMKFYRSPEYYASSNWKGTWALDGGGALMNQGIHGIDMLLYVMGSAKTVFGKIATLARDIEVEDMASAVVEFDSGAVGVIQATTCAYPGSARRMEICGDKGTIVIEGDRIIRWELENGEPYDLSDNTSSNNQTFKDPKLFSIEGHIKQISEMVDAVFNDRRPFVDQYEGKRTVDLILAIYESSRRSSIVTLDNLER